MNPFLVWLIRHLISNFVEHELAPFVDGDYLQGETAADPVYVQRLQVRYEVTGATGQPLDIWENVLHFVNTGEELPGSPATPEQKAAVEAAFNSYWSSHRALAGAYVKLKEYRWFRFTLDDFLSGPANRITTIGSPLPGTGLSDGPSQPAMSVTLRTGLRKHWGRFYLPLQAQNSAYEKGQLSSTTTTNAANAARTFINAAAATSLVPVVFSPTKVAVFSVAAVEVDSVPDVIRRRRPQHAAYKAILTSAS